jgi:hypothetical protein
MDEQAAKKICLALIKADTEDEVVSILQQAGLWDDGNSWRYYGGYENNYNTIGNQQSRPEAALVEKIINAVDARLMNEALVRGIDPEGENAPTSVREAVAEFFDENLKKGSKTAGLVREWPDSKRTEVARGIAVFTTGKMPREGYPCVNIVDYGEGQAPDDFDETFLSLTRSNKVRIPFVQGKYNMGGTGVLKFCGTRNLQLLVSRRNPDIADREKHEKDSCKWGYTIVRREDPSGGRRNSVYTYLAPVASALGNGRGVLRFESDSLALFPEGKKPYSRRTSWGTLV